MKDQDALAKLRPEILRRPAADGGVDLLDLLFERIHHLTPREIRGLERRDPIVMLRLERDSLLEGLTAERLRAGAWAARTDADPRPVVVAEVPEADWSLATSLPALVNEPWRDPERWRRLAEDRAGGQRYLLLRDFVQPEVVDRIAAAAAALTFEPMSTPIVTAHRHLLAPDELTEWREFLLHDDTRALFGAVLGRPLPAATTANVWRLDEGDFMAVHADSRRYQGTISLGLNRGWTAANGGAIALGDPAPGGFIVRLRWLPHAGDLGLFAAGADTWHVVEPVVGRRRYTLTTWWVDQAHAL